ncbi:DUF1206 domain-containing protein [Nocardioides aquiterrae]|uniref:DUF1206 domain-containing protein n=1 Tax=Nocardioides aquiterrae TaxID=203799 RepID=A0ABP4EYH4_9ACTN
MRTPLSTERSSRHSPTSRDDRLKYLGRAGLVAYAVVYLMIAWLAVQLAFGDRAGNPSSTGALRELAQQPLGEVLVWAVSLGMFLLALWMAAEAVLGDDGAGKRLAAAGKAVVYVAIGFSGVKVAVGAGSSGKGEDTWTAKLMNVPAGQVLVGLVGLAIIAFGIYELYRAWTDKYAEMLTQEGRRGASGTAYLWFGKIGCAARGVAFAIVGGLFVYAAITHDAKKSGGLDQALYKVLAQPFGPVLLTAIGLGLACFGLFTLARARHLRD